MQAFSRFATPHKVFVRVDDGEVIPLYFHVIHPNPYWRGHYERIITEYGGKIVDQMHADYIILNVKKGAFAEEIDDIAAVRAAIRNTRKQKTLSYMWITANIDQTSPIALIPKTDYIIDQADVKPFVPSIIDLTKGHSTSPPPLPTRTQQSAELPADKAGSSRKRRRVETSEEAREGDDPAAASTVRTPQLNRTAEDLAEGSLRLHEDPNTNKILHSIVSEHDRRSFVKVIEVLKVQPEGGNRMKYLQGEQNLNQDTDAYSPPLPETYKTFNKSIIQKYWPELTRPSGCPRKTPLPSEKTKKNKKFGAKAKAQGMTTHMSESDLAVEE